MSIDRAEVELALKRLTKVDPVLGKVRRLWVILMKMEKGGYEILGVFNPVAADFSCRRTHHSNSPAGTFAIEENTSRGHGRIDRPTASVRRNFATEANASADLTRCTLDGTICFRRLRISLTMKQLKNWCR